MATTVTTAMMNTATTGLAENATTSAAAEGSLSSSSSSRVRRRSFDDRQQQQQQQQQNHPLQHEGMPPPPPPTTTTTIMPVIAANSATMLSSASNNSAGGDFSDMPSLSSYRSWDDKSAASSSRGGDCCDVSLPSLSSYRLDEVSMASSYHSRGSAATHHLSHNYNEEEASAEGWASFTSGNVSKSDLDDSDEDEDDHDGEDDDKSGGERDNSDEFACASSTTEDGPIVSQMRRSRGRPSTVDVSSSSSLPAPSLPPAAIETKPILRNEGDGLASTTAGKPASELSLISFGSSSDGMIDRNTTAGRSEIGTDKCPPLPRSSNSSLDDSLDERFESTAAASCLSPNSMNPLNEEPNVLVDADSRFMAEGSTIIQTDRERPSEGRRGTIPDRRELGRNESMPMSELQRKLPCDQQQRSSSSSNRYSADGSSSTIRGGGDSVPRLPRRTSTMPDEEEDDRKKPQKIGGGPKKNGGGEKGCTKSDDASVSNSSSSTSEGGFSLLDVEADEDGDSTDCSVQTMDDDSVVSLERTGAEIPVAAAHPSHHYFEDQMNRGISKTPAMGKISTGRLKSMLNMDAGSGEEAIAVPRKRNSDALDINDISSKLSGVFVSLTSRTSSSERASAVAGSTSEEAGTSGTETELEDTDGGSQSEGVRKRGTLIRRMSSSLLKVGRSASFRAIGKTASKIRQISRRKDKDSPDNLRRSASDEPKTM